MMPSKQAFISDYFCSTKPKAQDDELVETQPSRRQVAGAVVQTKNNHDNITDKNTTNKNTTTNNNSPNKKLKVAATLKSPPAEVDRSYQSLIMPQYQPNSLVSTGKGRKKVASSLAGVEIAVPTNVATSEEFEAFNADISSRNVDGSSMSTALSPTLFRYMQKIGLITLVPHEVFFLSQDRAEKPREQCVRLAANPNFVSLSDDFEPGYHPLDDKGDGYRVSKQGQIFFPVVYYICSEGFAISCNREYVTPSTAKIHLQNGTADILGRRFILRGGRRENRYFIRSYSIMSCKKEAMTSYRFFQASHYEMSGQQGKAGLAAVVLTTLVGPRPEGFIAQHDGEKWDNSIDHLRWIPHRENYLKENLDPQAAEKHPYTDTNLPIDESTLDTDCWYHHPTQSIQVNETGTHVYHVNTQIFLTITFRIWSTIDLKKSLFCVDRKTFSFDRLALECFIGRELHSGETCEHVDCDRANNSKGNLLPRYRLFQANAKKAHKFSVDDKKTGVYEMKNGKGWIANVRMYTPDSCTASVNFTKYFWNKQCGGSDEAKKAAVEFRRKSTLRDGMIYT